jgi:hypothetical protein
MALVIGMTMIGCDAPPGEPVPLLTGVGPGLVGNGGQMSCYTDFAEGLLIVDPTYGTAIIDHDLPFAQPKAVTIAWRNGFAARRVRSEVEVLDPAGNVVAITGHNYRIAGGYTGRIQTSWPSPPGSMFVACDFVIPI